MLGNYDRVSDTKATVTNLWKLDSRSSPETLPLLILLARLLSNMAESAEEGKVHKYPLVTCCSPFGSKKRNGFRRNEASGSYVFVVKCT